MFLNMFSERTLSSGAFELVAEVVPDVATVNRLQEVRHGLKMLLPQRGEFVQELWQRVYEVRKIALTSGRGLPVVTGKGGSRCGSCWRPIHKW